MVRQAHGHTAQSEQMQGGNESEGINVEGWAEPGLRTVICWGRDWCLFVGSCRHHKLISFERASRHADASQHIVKLHPNLCSAPTSFYVRSSIPGFAIGNSTSVTYWVESICSAYLR